MSLSHAEVFPSGFYSQIMMNNFIFNFNLLNIITVGNMSLSIYIIQ